MSKKTDKKTDEQKTMKEPSLFSKSEEEIIKKAENITDDEKLKKEVERLKKDRLEKKARWEVLKEQYPELKKMRDLSEYIPTLTKAVANRLGIPIDGITILGGYPYINKTGLLYILQRDGRKVKVLRAEPVVLPIEVANIYGDNSKIIFSKDKTVLFRGILEFQDGSHYEDYGSANPNYLTPAWGKMSSMIPYTIELASTRATNRVIRLATGVGLASYEEMNESVTNGNVNGGIFSSWNGNNNNNIFDKEKEDLIIKIENEAKSKKLTEAQMSMLIKKVGIEDGRLELANKEKLKKLLDEVYSYGSERSERETVTKKRKDRGNDIIDLLNEIDKMRVKLKIGVDEMNKIYDEYIKKKDTDEVTKEDLLNVIDALKEIEKRHKEGGERR